MPVPPRRAARPPARPGALCALLLLLLLSPSPAAGAGPAAAVVRELRCVCLHTAPRGVRPRNIAGLQVMAPGPQCPRTEVVASLRDGSEVCLDPGAPLIKKIIKKYLNSGNKKN
ncbi:C-X-C motif chemokine 6 [Microcebus murinus]|uniref:alveolar macrophage chemotactic factor-like n=1 Tax=Microcebus murinus TaxID=30608 RepID=UPI003F6A69CF